MVPVMIIAGVVLVAGLVMGGIYMLTRGGSSRADWMKFMPDDAQVIARFDMDDFRSSGLYEKIKQANPAAEAQIQQGLRGTSLRFEDIDSIAIGGLLSSQDKVVAVIQTTRAISESEMAGSTTKRTGEGRRIYDVP